jgi:hypothetical protein
MLLELHQVDEPVAAIFKLAELVNSTLLELMNFMLHLLLLQFDAKFVCEFGQTVN